MTTSVYTGFPARGFKARARALGPPLAIAAGAGLGCVVLWLGDPTTPGGPLPVCPTKSLLGIACPGCGGMRMVYSALHGDIPAALHYNAVSFVVVLLLVWSTAAWAVGRLRGRAVNSWLHWRWTPLAFGVVFVVWFIIRNLPFAPFTSLYV
ncbi:hypothetical protein DL991_19940 [Amycolatopsis sp. WAC 01375]|uniref:DUF2752 domain-containing protein n=1 Tax=unclassified Amycolatopsis TaxID=2618356 RepID=UPI000F77BABE|nr:MULTISPECIES: DUF2752 domain-containing protein [unclassified Amycolatopsis]RSM77400.1 hypothetical protein DL991_19940 [Amycolatopsis sp. WAC 01375]RSN30522.1 hypothetical protein DL990_21270 [Amycolatopsis sp. WAC 01416]